MILEEKDLEQVNVLGMTTDEVFGQIENFKKGFPYLPIHDAATIGNGIIKFSEESIIRYINIYERKQSDIKIIKFVPASGAATRMFKDLFEYLNDVSSKIEELPKVREFFSEIENFAFYNDLSDALVTDGHNLEKALSKKDYRLILAYLLNSEGLNYGSSPKGLIKFHHYEGFSRTAIEEHLIEGLNYCQSTENKVLLHFTVSSEHLDSFKNVVDKAIKSLENDHPVTFEVTFSEQKPSTNTIAVDLDNNPFRESDGNILFRPGGHGALLANLNDLMADVIFIKNIDNVVPDKIKPNTYKYKKALAGLLLDLKQKIKSALNKLNEQVDIENALKESESLLVNELFYKIPQSYYSLSRNDQLLYLIDKLNRPVRICGMVKNEGEPGGGPFWVKSKEGAFSLQIAETSQIDLSDPSKQLIVNQATHFNPVDIVCSNIDYQGNKFDLTAFKDPETGFISEKSKNGQKLKAQELPGLWNGAMANWNTIFVEVPIITFNPVKTVNDLLRPQHQ